MGPSFNKTESLSYSYRSNAAQAFLRDQCIFIGKDEWPPNHCVWNVLEDAVYERRRQKFDLLEELRTTVETAWRKVSLDTIRRSIPQ